MARLVVNREEADLVTHELTRDIVTIGCAPLNHIVIDDPAVSAQHAMLARVADSYRLKDLHSTNGTQVNGISITDAELKDGDKIQFGSVVVFFCGTLQTLMKQMSSSLAGPLILPVPAQIERESPMATAQISPPSSRKSTLIAVAIAVLMIVGGAGWYLGHKREVAPEKLSGSSTQVERQIPIVVTTQNWEEKGLPRGLNLRIALHAGPVYEFDDPITGNRSYGGTHVSRAARIEPIAPPSQVYASEAFAALAAAQRTRDFTCDYVGQTPMAKGYGTLPMYHVRRSSVAARL